MPPMQWVWLAALVVFLLLEASTSALVSLWFVGGALAALIAALCGGEFWLQCVLFFAVSVLLLLCLRPLLRRFYEPRRVATNAQSIVGKTTIVRERIDNLQNTGVVRLSGVEWSARSANDTILEEGTVVRVVGIDGIKLRVERAEES